MNEESLEEIAQKGDEIRIMVQNSEGWKRVLKIIEEIRMEAFRSWNALPLNALPQDAIAIRANEQVLSNLLERIEDCVVKGDEARERMSENQRAEESERLFMSEKMTSDSEIENLRKPILNRILEAITH